MISYRRAEEKDNHNIRKLYEEVSIEMKVAPIFYQGVLSDVLLVPSSLDMWVGCDGDKIVAMAAITNGEINHVMVHPDYRRQKIGTALLNLIKSKYGSFHLSCFNEGAFKFYSTFMKMTHEEEKVSKRTGEAYKLYHFSTS